MISLTKSKGQTFVFGAIILMLSNVAVKVIGAFLRVPLTNIIGVDGMAYYNAAYSIYVSFYMISTAGIPVAVSRMIATANSKNNYKEIKRIFEVAFRVFFVIGAVGTAVMMIFAKSFSSSVPGSYYAMLAIAPTIFFICLASAYRGFFQGHSNMIPTAVSQVIEAAAKMGIGIFAAIYFTSKGYPFPVVAAYVILGVTIGVLLGLVYCVITKVMFNNAKVNKENLASCTEECRSSKSIFKELVIIAIPITLASSIMGLTNVADTFFFPWGLSVIGVGEEVATSFYGTYTSMVYPLFNLVPPFIYTFGISAIPAISSAVAVGNRKKAKMDIESAFRNCALIAVPCAIGFGVLSKNIIEFLFKDDIIATPDGNVSAIDIAAPALSVLSVAIIFLGVISITNSVLQACSKEKYTIVSTVIGLIVKIVATFTLSMIPGFDLLGAAIGTLLCYFTIMSFNLFFMIAKTGFVPNFFRIIIKPLIAGLSCGATALAVSLILPSIISSHRVVTIGSIAAAGMVYVFVILVIKGLNRYDVMMMPKGEKLCKVLDKFNLLGR